MTRTVVRQASIVAVLVVALAACSSNDGDDAESEAARSRAVAALVDFGLPSAQAECVADRMTPEVVVAAPEMDVLAAGQPYQDAIEQCPE